MIIAADKEGSIIFWSPGAERIIGFARTEVIDRSLDLVIPIRLRQRHWGAATAESSAVMRDVTERFEETRALKRKLANWRCNRSIIADYLIARGK